MGENERSQRTLFRYQRIKLEPIEVNRKMVTLPEQTFIHCMNEIDAQKFFIVFLSLKKLKGASAVKML